MSSYYQSSKNHAFDFLSTLFGVRKDVQEGAINNEKCFENLSNRLDKIEDHAKNTDNNVRQVLRNQNPSNVSLRNTTTPLSDEGNNDVISNQPTASCCSICHQPGHNKRNRRHR